MSLDAMKQALHTLEGWANHGEWVWPESALEQAKRNTTESIAALRERLAQPDQWQGLTKDEVDEWELPDRPTVFEFAKFVEAKLKEKNT